MPSGAGTTVQPKPITNPTDHRESHRVLCHHLGTCRSHHRLEIAAQLAVENNAAVIGMLTCPCPGPAWEHCLPDGARYLDSIRAARGRLRGGAA